MNGYEEYERHDIPRAESTRAPLDIQQHGDDYFDSTSLTASIQVG
jgi:hypothetical protein